MDILNYENFYKSKLLVEQHFHGCFGVDFSTCSADEILVLAQKLLTHGIGAFFPTLVTDSVDSIKRQISIIKEAKARHNPEMAEIMGIHLEGVFLNPNKKGIHDEKLFMTPTVENYKLIEDDFIKIVTLAPELDENGDLQRYLTLKGVKVQAGHCEGGDLGKCHGVTHLFNAMKGVGHREKSTALSALINEDIYTEIIADGVHLSDDILQLVFRAKPEGKIILVSDSLPIAGLAPSPQPSPQMGEGVIKMDFAGEKIFFDGEKAVSKEGTIAGSVAFLDRIVRRLALQEPEKFEKYVEMASGNVYKYHGFDIDGCVYWDEDFNIVAVEKGDFVLYKD